MAMQGDGLSNVTMDKDVISAAHKGLGVLDSGLEDEINALFEAIDHDHSGALSRAEVAQLLTDQNIVVESSYLDGVLDAYDLDQSGEKRAHPLLPLSRVILCVRFSPGEIELEEFATLYTVLKRKAATLQQGSSGISSSSSPSRASPNPLSADAAAPAATTMAGTGGSTPKRVAPPSLAVLRLAVSTPVASKKVPPPSLSSLQLAANARGGGAGGGGGGEGSVANPLSQSSATFDVETPAPTPPRRPPPLGASGVSAI